jgi:ribose 5-phosphate isomerase B
MTIILGADHGGYKLKETIKNWLIKQDYSIIDVGADAFDPKDDYPLYAAKVARQVVADKQALGILFCRSGAGMTIAANKIKGIRAVEVFNPTSAKHAKEHNNANIISLSADWLDLDQAKEIIDSFLKTEFTQEERHLRRINQIHAVEAQL